MVKILHINYLQQDKKDEKKRIKRIKERKQTNKQNTKNKPYCKHNDSICTPKHKRNLLAVLLGINKKSIKN